MLGQNPVSYGLLNKGDNMHKKLLLSEAYGIMHMIKFAHFNLENPVYLKITESTKFSSRYAAMYEQKFMPDDEEQKNTIHEIKLSFLQFKNDKNFLVETLAHELCHCEQLECGFITLDHNRAFFSRLDYVLAQLGLPPTNAEYRKVIKQY